MNSLRSKFSKLIAVVRDEGAGATLKRSWLWLKTRFVDSGDTIWLVKTVAADDAAPDSDGFTLARAGSPADHERLDRLRPLDADVQKLRESVGGSRWFLTDSEDNVAFTCWTFSECAIVAERPAVTLPLPEHSFQLEDSYVPKAMRKSRGSVIAIEMVARRHLAEAETPSVRLYTKIDAENTAALKAAAYGNWERFAVVTATRLLSRFTRWQVEQDSPPAFEALSGLADA